jgi:hypothetical protein
MASAWMARRRNMDGLIMAVLLSGWWTGGG